jgi:HlyD family secretion protein
MTPGATNGKGLLRVVRQRPLLVVLAVIAVVAVGVVTAKGRKTAPAAQSYYAVKRGSFLVTILEGGTLRATQELIVRSELEGTPRIISIVPEGTSVKKGDLLVELDSVGIKEKIVNQELSVQSAESSYTRAKEDLAIQKLTMDASVKDQELRVEFAESDLEKYKEGDWPQQKKAIEARITIAEEEMQRAQDRLNWTVQLEKRGYATRDELKADQLTVKRQELTITQAREELRLVEKYDFPKRVRLMESTVEQTKLELLRVRQRATSTISTYEADVKSKQAQLEKQRERLDDAREQLALARIFAPQEGLVVYATGSSSSSGILIEEGATVRQKQDIIKLPDVTQMMVEIRVHESHVRQVKPGLAATVTIDSLPDKQFTGVVKKVAVLPDSSSRYYNPNLKVYTTEVWINEELADIKPGVSGRAEIIVTNLTDVLTVPIQAVTTVRGQQTCYVEKNGRVQPVPVEVGLYNDRLIEVRRGLNEGDRVLLAALAATESTPPEDEKPAENGTRTNNVPKESEPASNGAGSSTLATNAAAQPGNNGPLPAGVRRASASSAPKGEFARPAAPERGRKAE